jgi:hypothetical protein
VDLFGERNDDEELLAWAAANGRVLTTCDGSIHCSGARVPRAEKHDGE